MSFNVFEAMLRPAVFGVIDKALSDLLNEKDRFGLYTGDGLPFYQKKGSGKVFDTSVINPQHVGVLSADYDGKVFVTNVPVEQGQFISINKVIMPRSGKVVYAYTGLVKHIKLFEERLEEYERGVLPLHFFTPERDLANVTITSHTVSRSVISGKSLPTVEVNFQEILYTAEGYVGYHEVNIGAKDSKSQGLLDPVEPTGSQQQAAEKTPD